MIDTVAELHANALFSKAEETLLGNIISTSSMNLQVFEGLLAKHPDLFHRGRTAKALQVRAT